MENQKGNFTNNKEDTFDPTNRYTGVRMQQGVPLLDRDWNELEDIRRYEEQMLRKYYICNGTPDDGFKISSCDPPDNNFKIGIGRCLVDGFEVVNELSEQNQFIYYTDQKLEVLNPSTGIKPRHDTVYLDVWIEEVGKDKDEKLRNSKDLNEETTIRHKLVWRVRVDEGSKRNYKNPAINPECVYHHYYDIAMITRKRGADKILDLDIQDLREVAGKKALDITRNGFKSAINSIMLGCLPSSPYIQLLEFDEASLKSDSFWILKYNNRNIWLNRGIIWLFWLVKVSENETNFWCKRFNNGIWEPGKQITASANNKTYDNSFVDNKDNIWLLWHTTESETATNFWYTRYSNGIWEPEKQITASANSKTYKNSIVDNENNIWLLWLVNESEKVSNFWCNRYSNGIWEPEKQITASANNKTYDNSFLDKDRGIIWIFWSVNENIKTNFWYTHIGSIDQIGSQVRTDSIDSPKIHIKSFSYNYYNWFFWTNMLIDLPSAIFCTRNDSSGWVEPIEITSETLPSEFLNTFNDHEGNLWVFWSAYEDMRRGNINFICKKFSSDEKWDQKNTKLTSDAKNKKYINSFVDIYGNLWFFWASEENDGVSNLRFKMYSKGKWGPEKQITFSANDKYYLDSFENGNIWIFYSTAENGNIWCEKYSSGDWMPETRLLFRTTRNEYFYSFVDTDGNVSLFWIDNIVYPSKNKLMFIQIFSSL